MHEGRRAQRVELRPDRAGRLRVLDRRAPQDLVLDRPPLQARAPRLDGRLQAVDLGVDEHGEHQRLVGHHARRQALDLAALEQLGRGRRDVTGGIRQALAGVRVDLQQRLVAALLGQQRQRQLSRQAHPGDRAQRRVVGRERDADGLAVAAGGVDPASHAAELGVEQHPCLVMLLDDAAALRAHEVGARDALGLGVELVPEVLAHQLVEVVAVRAWHVVPRLRAEQEQLVDLRLAQPARAADLVRLVDPLVRREPRLGQLDLVALAAGGTAPGRSVDLVAEEVPRRDLGEVRIGAGRGEVDRAAVELLRLQRVALVSRARRGDLGGDGVAGLHRLREARR
ncbi:MAG: hypothetical protein BWZ09_02560 [Alphaproteobacteria bacterium ADurb.BinA305]|nr:MAG: hypothetical protein BWZ09_02560 [Alphaproteobacteria bacterium ADurb.BinA305]